MFRTKRGATTAEPQAASAPETLEEALAWVAELSDGGANLRFVAEGLLREKFALHAAIAHFKEQRSKLREKVEALTAPEHYPAVITSVHCNGQAAVEVYGGGTRLEVAVDPEIPRERLRVGARGLLSRTRNCLVEVDQAPHEWSEVGTFEGYLDDRKRLLLRYQEQLLAATASDDLADEELRKGDLIGFDRDGPRLAFSRVQPPGRDDLFFAETPADRFEELGGLDREIALLKRLVRFRLLHPDVAARYRLPAKHGILLEGPPGNGKTKLARCLARFIADLVPQGECRFMAVSGSGDYSMWLGQSEQRIIARFEAARALAADGAAPVIMFFDEIDAIGRRRGSDLGGTASDRILATFLAQLDGIRQVSNLIVLGATNRADVLDGGLLRPGRLGDVKIRIPGPNRQAARAILTSYLGSVPVAGEAGFLVETLLSSLYSPQGEYAELVRVTLRDGRKLPVGGRELVSGAMLENIV
ncbi:MAG TPA: AAA family ATPase, partial [Gemmataceae bacterium]|nr:AAA family ATPase [Gemmataceae bacterium]